MADTRPWLNVQSFKTQFRHLVDEDGDPIDYKNQWHFKAINKVKTDKMNMAVAGSSYGAGQVIYLALKNLV